jgi:hypothetical protein
LRSETAFCKTGNCRCWELGSKYSLTASAAPLFLRSESNSEEPAATARKVVWRARRFSSPRNGHSLSLRARGHFSGVLALVVAGCSWAWVALLGLVLVFRVIWGGTPQTGQPLYREWDEGPLPGDEAGRCPFGQEEGGDDVRLGDIQGNIHRPVALGIGERPAPRSHSISGQACTRRDSESKMAQSRTWGSPAMTRARSPEK